MMVGWSHNFVLRAVEWVSDAGGFQADVPLYAELWQRAEARATVDALACFDNDTGFFTNGDWSGSDRPAVDYDFKNPTFGITDATVDSGMVMTSSRLVGFGGTPNKSAEPEGRLDDPLQHQDVCPHREHLHQCQATSCHARVRTDPGPSCPPPITRTFTRRPRPRCSAHPRGATGLRYAL